MNRNIKEVNMELEKTTRKDKKRVDQGFKLKQAALKRIIITGEKFPDIKERMNVLMEKVNAGRVKPTATYEDFLNYVLEIFTEDNLQELIHRTQTNEVYARFLWQEQMTKNKTRKPFQEWLISQLFMNQKKEE